MARGDADRMLLSTELVEQLLAGGSRNARAKVYAEAIVRLSGARAVAVTWRRRSSVFALTRHAGTDDVVKRQFPKGSKPHAAFDDVLALTEGEIVPSEGAWVPLDVAAASSVVLLLPEGTSGGAPRIFVADADPARLDEMHRLLRALRPHWIERRTLRRRAAIDHLTGTYNFRYLRRYLKLLCSRARRGTASFSLLMLDVDRLREYNAQFGHLMGSRVLAQLGGVLRRVVRQGDFVAKYGGDEFLIIIQGADKPEAVDIALRFKEAIGRQAFQGVPSGYITCSIGVSTFGEDGETFRTLVAAADHATFTAKDRGRNTVVAAGREKTTHTAPPSR